jgi:hypothetical protein
MELNEELLDTGAHARAGMVADMHDLVGMIAIALSLDLRCRGSRSLPEGIGGIVSRAQCV